MNIGESTWEISGAPDNYENYERCYGSLDYRGKIVLDIGADVGSTALFFYKKGARKVIAVEPNDGYFKQLLNSLHIIPGTIPIKEFINKPSQIEFLIKKYKPNIVKLDCENCEQHLLGVKDEILSLVPEYIMEIHEAPAPNVWGEGGLEMLLIEKFKKNFEAVKILEYGLLFIYYFKKRKVINS